MTQLRNLHSVYLAYRTAPGVFWAATAFTLGMGVKSRTARTAGLRMLSWGGRVTLNVAKANIGAVMNTPLRWGGTATLRTSALAAGGTLALYGSAVTAGYAIGATVGTSVSYAIYGDRGARDALNFYSGGVSPQQYASIVGAALGVP